MTFILYPINCQSINWFPLVVRVMYTDIFPVLVEGVSTDMYDM